VEEEPPGWCAGVDGVGEAPELDTVLVQIADQSAKTPGAPIIQNSAMC
jgi:hypothetical protein